MGLQTATGYKPIETVQCLEAELNFYQYAVERI